jgi:hypothetical protein
MARRRDTTFTNEPKYPFIRVQVAGTGGGFHPTVAAVQAAMTQAGIPEQELSNFYEDAAEGDEDNLLRTCMRWVDVDVR